MVHKAGHAHKLLATEQHSSPLMPDSARQLHQLWMCKTSWQSLAEMAQMRYADPGCVKQGAPWADGLCLFRWSALLQHSNLLNVQQPEVEIPAPSQRSEAACLRNHPPALKECPLCSCGSSSHRPTGTMTKQQDFQHVKGCTDMNILLLSRQKDLAKNMLVYYIPDVETQGDFLFSN